MAGKKRTVRANQQEQSPDKKAAVHADDPMKLSFEEWEEKAIGTDVLRGWLAVKDNDDYEIKVASRPAFKLKPQKANISYNKHAEVKETRFKTHLEQRLLEASFTKTTIQAAISSSAPGFMLGVSGDASWRKELSSSSSRSDDAMLTHVSHIFPKATMHLGTYDLEPSEECLDFLKEVLVDVEGPDAGDGAVDAALEKFEELFGSFFAKEVTLGGRRYEVKKARERSESKTADEKVEKKLKGGIEASSMVAGGKLDVERDKGQSFSLASGSSAENRQKGLQLIGGNESLYNNAEKWADSTGPRSKWKAIEYDAVGPLLPHLKWVLVKNDKGGSYSKLCKMVTKMWTRSEELESQALRSITFSIRLTLKSTITAKKTLGFLDRSYRIFEIEPIEGGIIEWISVTIPEARIKEKVYRPQVKMYPYRISFPEDTARPPISVKVKGLDVYQVYLVFQLKKYRWKNPPPSKNPEEVPDFCRYPLNWTLSDVDDETSFDLDYEVYSVKTQGMLNDPQ